MKKRKIRKPDSRMDPQLSELRELMHQKGIPSYRQLALMCNLAPSAFSMFLGGYTNTSRKVAPLVSSALGITQEKLYSLVGRDPNTIQKYGALCQDPPGRHFYSSLYGIIVTELTKTYHSQRGPEQASMVNDLTELIEKYSVEPGEVKGSVIIKSLLEYLLRYQKK